MESYEEKLTENDFFGRMSRTFACIHVIDEFMFTKNTKLFDWFSVMVWEGISLTVTAHTDLVVLNNGNSNAGRYILDIFTSMLCQLPLTLAKNVC